MPSKYDSYSLEELDQQLNLLKTVREVGDALSEFSVNLADFTGSNLETKLSDDATVDWLLGQLKPIVTGIEKISEPYAKLTEPAGTVGAIASRYETVLNLVKAFKDGEGLTGSEKAQVLGKIVEGLPDLASWLAGLGSLNPVIGVFLGLYGKALESAAVVIAQVEERHGRQIEMIRSRGEIDIEALLAEQEAASEAKAEAEAALDREYNDALDAFVEKKLQKAGSDRRVATRYCVRRNEERVHQALSSASRFPTRGAGKDVAVVDRPSVDEGDIDTLNDWLEGIDSDIATAMSAGDAERARKLSDAKYEVLDALAPVNECIIERLYWMEENEGFSFAGVKRKVVVYGGGGILAMAIAIPIVLNLGGDGLQIGGCAGSSSDPTGDLTQAWESSDPVENPDSGGDITGMSVAETGEGVEVTINFAGSTQDMTDRTGQTLAADLLVTPPGGGRVINVLWDLEGRTKISDPPAGMSVTSEWMGPGELVFAIRGLECSSGTTFWFGTIHGDAFSDTSTDSVELAVA